MGFMNRFSELPRKDREIDSIVDNLRHILNSKEGYGWVVHSYGLGQYYAQVDTMNTVKTLLQEMMEDILAYEPRLKEPALDTHGRDSEMWLNISLKGTVKGQVHHFRIRFNQVYGNVEVELAKDE